MRKLSACLVAISALGLVTGITVPIAINIINNNDTQFANPKYFKYNHLMQNLSNFDNGEYFNQTEKEIYDFYTRNTRPLFMFKEQKNRGKIEIISGTMWRFPNWKRDNRTYFATNIHVVNKALIMGVNTELNKYVAKINKDYTFMTNKPLLDSENEQNLYSGSINASKQSLIIDDVKVEWLKSIRDEYESILGTNNANYSDFIILSTSTPCNELFITDDNLDDGLNNNIDDNKQFSYNFIDTKDEYERALKQLKADKPIEKEIIDPITNRKTIEIWDSNNLYLCGFPSTKSIDTDNFYNYVTIKYTNACKSYTSTARNQLKNNYYNEQNGICVFASNSTNIFHSYANQLLMPELYIPAGSSGSLVTIVQDGIIKPLGIWWGEYSSGANPYAGSLDFFYSPDYLINSNPITIVEGYCNLPQCYNHQ